MLSLFRRFVIIVTVVVAAMDVIVFHHLKQNGIESLTWQFETLVIFITVLPIAINLWFWLIFKQRNQ